MYAVDTELAAIVTEAKDLRSTCLTFWNSRMGILGLGVDIVHLPRIASLVSRRTSARLASRILSAAELSEWENLSSEDMLRQTRFLAVR